MAQPENVSPQKSDSKSKKGHDYKSQMDDSIRHGGAPRADQNSKDPNQDSNNPENMNPPPERSGE